MPNYRWLLPLTVLLCLAVPAAASAEDVLRYAGATTLQRSFMPEVARLFLDQTGVRIQIEGGNTNPGLRALLKGEVEMAGAGRYLTAEEKRQGLVEHFLGWDVLAVVVSQSLPIDSLTRAQLQKIYAGDIVNWKDVGGPDQPIVVVTSPKGSGMRDAVQDLILRERSYTGKEVIAGVVAQADQQVAMFPAAVTAISLSMVDTQRTKTLRIDDVAATKDNVQAGRYPLAKPLTLVTRGRPQGQLARFLELATGERGRAILGRHFAPVAPR